MDVEALLQPVNGSQPCGPDLEYDPVFIEMNQAAQGKQEQQYGDTLIEAVPPDWQLVQKKALDLLGRTKDLRVAALLGRAALASEGLTGLRDVLALLRGYVVRFWATVHPLLDPDDDNDPTIRNNQIASLADLGTTILMLRNVPLVRSRAIGQFSRRDIALAKREVPAQAGVEPPSTDTIDAAFQDCDVKQLADLAAAAKTSFEHVRGIDVAIGDEIGHGNGPNLQNLSKELDGIRKILEEQLARRGYDPDRTADEAVNEEAAPTTSASSTPALTTTAAAAAAPTRFSGEFTCREEAIRAIDAVCVWFEKYEPSSPLPLLLKRAKRLSTKSFLEILRDISPGGLGEAEMLGGLAAMALEPAPAAPAPSSAPSRPAEKREDRRRPRDPDAE